MYALQNGTQFNRLGISVSKRVGNSVVRHTFARRIREIFRLNQYQTEQGYDIIILARNRQTGEVSYRQLERDYQKLLDRLQIRSDRQAKVKTGIEVMGYAKHSD